MGGTGGAFNEIWMANPDLSRVDEVGFADLMPGGGHGTGGYVHVSQVQVYGRPVPRAAPRPAASARMTPGAMSPLVALVALVLALPAQRAELAPTGALRASFIGTNPVQGRVDPATGATTGPAPDLTRELARRLGVPHAITPLPDAGAVLDSVRNGRADIGFLAYEAERATLVDYSDPYSIVGSAYVVRADSGFGRSADLDREGVSVGAVTGQSQEVFVRQHLTRARVQSMAEMPAHAALAAMLLDGRLDAFAANRTRMEELARDSNGLRVLSDNFMTVGQAIVVARERRSVLEEINRFLADVRASGFVQASLDRANVVGVEVAP